MLLASWEQNKTKSNLILVNKMPRRRKIGGSPSRNTGAAAVVPQGDPSLSVSQPAYSVSKEELFNSMSEMFSDLDPSVVYMVLSECDFKGKYLSSNFVPYADSSLLGQHQTS